MIDVRRVRCSLFGSVTHSSFEENMRKWAEKESLDIFRRRWEGVRGGVGIGEFPRYDQKEVDRGTWLIIQ